MKALFIGLGGVGQRHLRNLLALRPDAEIGAIRHGNRSFEIGNDLKPDHSVDIVEKYGITLLPDTGAALEWGPDLAVIASPSSKHIPPALDLAKAGVPLMIEKPVSHDAEGPRALLKTASAATMVGYVLRFHPTALKLFDWIDRGKAGDLLSAELVCHNFLPFSHSYEAMNEYYLGRKDLGGGVVLSEIHSVDMAYRLFGMPRKIWSVGGRLGAFECDVEDTVTCLMECGPAERPFPVRMHISMVERPVERRVVIHGSKGRIDWDFATGELTFLDGESGEAEVETLPEGWSNLMMFENEMKHFVEVVEQGGDLRSSLAETLGGQVLAVAMLESLESGQPIETKEADQ